MEKENCVKLIEDMMRDEFIMAIALVGLISSDNNMYEEEIKKNLEELRQLKDAADLVVPEDEKQSVRLDKIKNIIERGIGILERDLVLIPAEARLRELLGEEKLDKMTNLYRSYFDPYTIETKNRDRYIFEKFGKCEEPTYDPLWNVWYLGDVDEDGNVDFYSIGSAMEIIGKYLGCYVSSEIEMLDEEGEVEVSAFVDIAALFKEAWENRKEGRIIRLTESDFLSPKEKELWEKIGSVK